MRPRSGFDPTLYAIADASALLSLGSPLLRVEEGIAGGVTAIQIRAKLVDDSDFLSFAEAVLERARPAGVACIVNDRIDVALAAGADGVHLGAGDFPPGVARRLLGQKAFIGVTAHTQDEVRGAAEAGADYIGFGSTYPSPTKRVEDIQGLEGVAEARKLTRLPIVAIGGITVERAADVIAAGADGIAVISGLWSADDTRVRAGQFIAEIRRGLELRRSR